MTDVEATLNCFTELVTLGEIVVDQSQMETMSLFYFNVLLLLVSSGLFSWQQLGL